MNILDKANQIVNQRTEEKSRCYGDFNESMINAAKIASLMVNKEVDVHTMFACMYGLKMSRNAHNIKTFDNTHEDSMLDMCAYLGAHQNYVNTHKNIKPKILNNNKYKMYQELYNAPEIEVRGLKTKELLNYKLVIQPYDRFFNFEGRKMNLKYIKEEFKWYCKGDKFDTSITKHAKMWKSLINEDGSINSNYGQYIKPNFARCLETLVNDKYSRRAIIMIGNNDNFSSKTKDYCCTLSMSFQIRNNKLLMTIHMRSCDCIFGLTNDIPTFSFFHEMMYVCLRDTKYPDLELGEYTHLADSFHVYERHYKMLKNIIENAYEYKVECPKIESAIEVDKIFDGKLEDCYAFSKWLSV